MELVSGLPLDEYCDTRQLPLRQRVRLIIEVAKAVHYAHRNFLVHRDLKPSNILVEETGRVRLLDFGIAKQLDPDPIAAAHTQTGALLLTPRYSSPEQFTGGTITTSSDQFQLGLLLFELVTGHCHHLLEGEDLGPMGRRLTDLTASELLERGRQGIEGKLAEQPLIQARMMGKIAEIHRKLGLYQEAVPLAEKALESQRRIRGPRDPEVALALRALGRLQADSGDDASAEPSLRGAEEIFAAQLGATSIERAETLLDLGSLEYRRGDLGAAEETYLRGQSILEASDQASPKQRTAAVEALGTLYFAKRELEKAEALQRQVVSFREGEFDQDHPDLA